MSDRNGVAQAIVLLAAGSLLLGYLLAAGLSSEAPPAAAARAVIGPEIDVYSGPGAGYPVLTTLADESVEIAAASIDGAWLQIRLPQGSPSDSGWVEAAAVTVEGDLDGLPRVSGEATPVALSPSTSLPTATSISAAQTAPVSALNQATLNVTLDALGATATQIALATAGVQISPTSPGDVVITLEVTADASVTPASPPAQATSSPPAITATLPPPTRTQAPTRTATPLPTLTPTTPPTPTLTPTPEVFSGTVQITLAPDAPAGLITPDNLDLAASIVQQRLEALGMVNVFVTAKTDGTLLVEFTGDAATPEEVILAAVQSQGVLEFVDMSDIPLVDVNNFVGHLILTTGAERRTIRQPLVNPATGEAFVTVLVGNIFEDAQPALDAASGQWTVAFTLTSEAAEVMAAFTAEHIGDPLAITLDGIVLTVPTIQSQIGREGIITGDFAEWEARRLAIQLRTGALPFPLTAREITTLGGD